MLLAINIGNSNITLGGYDADGKQNFSSRLFSDSTASADELTYKFVNLLELYGLSPAQVDGVILASVVPVLTARVREASAQLFEARLMVVGPGLKSGVPIRLDSPAQLGGELLCAVVAALRRTRPPLLVLNLDTATTLLAVNAAGVLVGGAILPGPRLSLEALVKNTAQLPQVELEAAPKALLGTNTADCLHSGIVNGTAAMLDGLIARFRQALDAPDAPVLATGVLPESIRTACLCPIEYRESLILDGLYEIWRRNKR